MKRSRDNLLKLIVVLLVFCLIPATTAQAKKTKAPWIAKNNSIDAIEYFSEEYNRVRTFYRNSDDRGYQIKNLDPSTDVNQIKVTCSTKRARAYVYRSSETGAVYLGTIPNSSLKNPFVTLPKHYTITLKFKQNKKNYKLKTRITVKPYKNKDITSLKICGKNVTSKVKQSKVPVVKAAGKKFTYAIKLKKGLYFDNVLLRDPVRNEDDGYDYNEVPENYVLKKGDVLDISYYQTYTDEDGDYDAYSSVTVVIK